MLPTTSKAAPCTCGLPAPAAVVRSSRRRISPLCRAESAGSRAAAIQNQPQYYPGLEEELEVSQAAFHSAFADATPAPARIPGLAEFAASMWERRKHIPSKKMQDPLHTIFDEFDHNSDGFLAAPEIATALRSRGVEIEDEQVQWLINTFEKERTCALPYFAHVIAREEFPQFVYSLTISDLHVQQDPSRAKLPSLDDDGSGGSGGDGGDSDSS